MIKWRTMNRYKWLIIHVYILRCVDTLINLNYVLLLTYYLRSGTVHSIKNICTFHTHQFPIDSMTLNPQNMKVDDRQWFQVPFVCCIHIYWLYICIYIQHHKTVTRGLYQRIHSKEMSFDVTTISISRTQDALNQ